MSRAAPPGAPTDFRGAPLQIGDIVAYPSSGRHWDLQEGVIKKLNPKMATIISKSRLTWHEEDYDVKITTAEQLLSVDGWETRYYDRIVKVGHIED